MPSSSLRRPGRRIITVTAFVALVLGIAVALAVSASAELPEPRGPQPFGGISSKAEGDQAAGVTVTFIGGNAIPAFTANGMTITDPGGQRIQATPGSAITLAAPARFTSSVDGLEYELSCWRVRPVTSGSPFGGCPSGLTSPVARFVVPDHDVTISPGYDIAD